MTFHCGKSTVNIHLNSHIGQMYNKQVTKVDNHTLVELDCSNFKSLIFWVQTTIFPHTTSNCIYCKRKMQQLTSKAWIMWRLSELCFHIRRANTNDTANHCNISNRPSSYSSYHIQFVTITGRSQVLFNIKHSSFSRDSTLIWQQRFCENKSCPMSMFR